VGAFDNFTNDPNQCDHRDQGPGLMVIALRGAEAPVFHVTAGCLVGFSAPVSAACIDWHDRKSRDQTDLTVNRFALLHRILRRDWCAVVCGLGSE
jgi:hypothetical protein